MKFSEAVEYFCISMTGVKAKSTIKWYRNYLSPITDFLGDPEIESVDLFALERYRASLDRKSKAIGRENKNVSVYTIHASVRAQKRFFNWLYRRRIIEKNPSDFLEKPKLPTQPRKGIQPQAAEKMLIASKTNARDYAILLFFRDTGCRAGGIYNLLTDNLDILHNKAIIREKGDKDRTVFFTSETALALTMYSAIRQNPNEEEKFFLNEQFHTPLTYFGVYQIFRRLAKQTKIKAKFSPHQWRHAAARSWLMAGMNIKAVSQLLGHTSEKVTADIYGTLSEQELYRLYIETIEKIYAHKTCE